MLKSVPCEPYLVGRVVCIAPPPLPKKEKKNHSKFIGRAFLCHGPLPFSSRDHLFCLSHHKTRWTMLVDYVGLKICLLGTSTYMVTLTFISLGVNQGRPGTSSTTNQHSCMAFRQVQQPINTLTWPWDDFIVHDVNNLLWCHISYPF